MTATDPEAQHIDVQLQTLIDRQEILDCIARCARGMDRHDAELLMSAYQTDAYDDHGTFRGLASDFVEYVNGVEGLGGVHADNYLSHQHLIMNHVAEIEGVVAHTETQYLFFGVLRSGDLIQVSGGRYVDRLERRSGRWGIADRRVVMEWTSELPAGASTRGNLIDRFTRGTWDRTDVSYQRPLEVRSPSDP